MSRLNNKGLLICHFLKVFLDKSVLEPVLAYRTCLAVGNQLVWIEGNLEIQVVIYHNLKCFSCKAVSLVLVNWLAVNSSFRSVSVGIYSAICFKFLHEFRSQLFVKLFWYVSQCVLQRNLCLSLCKSEASVRGSSYSLLKFRHFRISQIQLYCHCISNCLVFQHIISSSHYFSVTTFSTALLIEKSFTISSNLASSSSIIMSSSIGSDFVLIYS